jgi:LmbE family N-acetylglucosaminyl deacetylase
MGMLTLDFKKEEQSELSFLFLGAHCDDIEIGAGGTVIKLAEQFPKAHFHWVVFSSSPERAKEAEASAQSFLQDIPKKCVEIKNYRDGFFPYVGIAIKEYFEKLKQQVNPDVVFTHYRDDRHQDHRVISDLTWNTYRNHLILEYEISKYDGDLGNPNFFSSLPVQHVDKKIELLLTNFQSQLDRSWFDADTFKSILRIRGVECNAPERFAEAFYCRKAVF